MRLLLLLLSALALLLSPALAMNPSPAANATQMRELCDGFRVICDFVAAACDPSAASELDAKCLESFQLYYEHSHTLSACAFVQATSDPDDSIADADDVAAVASARAFLARYSAWQTAHVCELFHATEAKAAHACSGASVHRPWHRDAWPLFCRSVFATYSATRHQLDALCARTSHSDAFWEGYAEFSGSDTCKQYYADVRAAVSGDCGDADASVSPECVAMFKWYAENQAEIERDCLELHASKAFYRGFYKWKKAAHLRH